MEPDTVIKSPKIWVDDEFNGMTSEFVKNISLTGLSLIFMLCQNC